jgi:hypothetical protein
LEKGGGLEKGGDEFDFLEDRGKHERKKKESQISEEEIENLFLEEPDLGDMDDPIDIIFSNNTKLNKIESSKETKLEFIFDSDINIYAHDKISEFKKKVQIITQIPIYRQHLWFVSNAVSLPLSYSVSTGDVSVPINIQKISDQYKNGKLDEKAHQIDNIPLNVKMYDLSSSIKIECHDNFKILQNYTHKYDVFEYNVADLQEFISPNNIKLKSSLSKSKQQFNMIYYGFVVLYWPMMSIVAFRDYLKSEDNIRRYYPELYPDTKNMVNQYKMEKNIINKSIDIQSTNSTSKKIMSSITYAMITVSYVSNMKEKVIFVRNLFDAFKLDKTIDACRCIVSHNNKTLLLDKTYLPNNSKTLKEFINSDGIIFRINPTNVDQTSIIVIFYKNGNYIIKSWWREEYNHNFNTIYTEVKKLIDPLIKKINSMSTYVLYEGKKIPDISKFNYKFQEIGVNLYYKQVLTESQFAFLKFIMEEFKNAGIMRVRNVEKNFAEYHFRKGMYQFDARRIEKISNITNYYDYMSDGILKQKWFTLFEKTRITKFFHRFSDVKIEIYGIKEKEFNLFFSLIITMFHMYETGKSKNVADYEFKKLVKKKMKKSLTNLKEQDPVLYDFKNQQNSNKVYSRICQKSHQPMILNKLAFDKLSSGAKKNIVKYWNFTSETDAYYQCNNPKYPYIKFATKIHPKNYCIPCCQKIKISDDKSGPKRIIHDLCLQTHKYDKEKKNITIGSTYIMTYGKDLDAGRLSKLPENSMESLFYETFSMDYEKRASYTSTDGFFLYGVNQNTASLANVGFVYALAHALNMTVSQLTKTLIEKIKKQKNMFNILLNGKIHQYISNTDELIEKLSVFTQDSSVDFYESNIPWNKIFMGLAHSYMKVNTVLFQHKKNTSNVDLILPNGLEDESNYVIDGFSNIIILQKSDKYYPVYLINTTLFFKLGIIAEKTYESSSGLMGVIKCMVKKYLMTIQIEGKTYSKMNLIVLQAFLSSVQNKLFSVQKLFINHSNYCYAVQIHNKKTQKNICVPVVQSQYSFTVSPHLEFNPYLRSNIKYKQTFKTLMVFIDKFNSWVEMQTAIANTKNNKDIYSYIDIKSWLVLQKSIDFQKSDMVIGFKSGDLNYYFDDMDYGDAIKIQKINSIPILYDPDVINVIINKRVQPRKDERTLTLSKSLYKYNLYQLFLLEFLTVFHKKVNVSLRTQIKKLFLGDLTKKMLEVNNKLVKIIDDASDLMKIRIQINDFLNNHHDRKQLYMDIDNTRYQFDQIIIHKLITMSLPVLKRELEQLSKSFVTFGDIQSQKNFVFDNMFSTCSVTDKTPLSKNYCKSKKLIISKEKYKIFIDILSNDIKNPIKQKWIFSDILSDRVINFLQFIKRVDEKIQITQVKTS